MTGGEPSSLPTTATASQLPALTGEGSQKCCGGELRRRLLLLQLLQRAAASSKRTGVQAASLAVTGMSNPPARRSKYLRAGTGKQHGL